MISVLFCMSMIVHGLSDFYGNNAARVRFVILSEAKNLVPGGLGNIEIL